MIRLLFTVAALALLGAATHVNVTYAGGYQSADAPLIMAIAGFLAIGSAGAGLAWGGGHKAWAAVLVICLLAGEGYWLAKNAEREFAHMQAAEQPIADAMLARAKAEKRLDAAEATRKAAEAALISEAAKPGCRKECRLLLEGAAANARSELGSARLELEALPPAHGELKLSEQLGLPAWKWDLLLAGLRSLAIIGGSIAIGLALHPQRKPAVSKLEIVAESQITGISRNKPEIIAISKRLPAPKVSLSDRSQVASFLKSALKPEPGGATSLRMLHSAYMQWCDVQDVTPLPAAALARQLRSIVDAAGLDCEECGRDMVVKGAVLRFAKAVRG